MYVRFIPSSHYIIQNLDVKLYRGYKPKNLSFEAEDEEIFRGNFWYSDSTQKPDLETWGSDWHTD